MFCEKCGHVVSEDDLFCQQCGTRLIQADEKKKETGKALEQQVEKKSVSAFLERVKNIVNEIWSELNLKNIYLPSAFKQLTKKSGIPIIIYLLMNLWLICDFLSAILDIPYAGAVILGVMAYAASLALSTSAIGEYMLRMQLRCSKKECVEYRVYAERLFREVYNKAKQEDPELPDNIELYIKDDETVNAFAVGRRTLCVHKGLLSESEDMIKAVIAHEFGHLSHKDLDLVCLVNVGNFFIVGLIAVLQIIVSIFHAIGDFIAYLFGSIGILVVIYNFFVRIFIDGIIVGASWLWFRIGDILVRKGDREKEYEADAFAFELGYGYPLCALLDKIVPERRIGLFAALLSDHPEKYDRIDHLKMMGVDYDYGPL